MNWFAGNPVLPEVVKHYIEHKDLVVVGRIFENLITAYSDDVEKYAKNDNQRKVLRIKKACTGLMMPFLTFILPFLSRIKAGWNLG